MACFRPLRAFRTIGGKIVFSQNSPNGAAAIERPLNLPCGQCVGCRLKRAQTWALRCVHESKMHTENCFITLTYNDANLPSDGSLRHEDFQKFMKRFTERVRYSGDKRKIRFYMCGEYGEKLGRPHYHACIFNYDFPDKVHKRNNALGDKIYSSEFLDDCWNMSDPGMCEIGSVTMESAGYVARYIMKKITGDDAVAHYGDLKPEYTNMSKGIGKAWFEKNYRDIYPSDFIIHDGRRFSPPRYYDGLFELNFPSAFRPLRTERLRKSGNPLVTKDDDKDRRLRVRETVTNSRVKRLKKELDQ